MKNLYKHIIETSSIGYAYCQILANGQGDPIDFIYTGANASFQRLTNMTEDMLVGQHGAHISGYIELKIIDLLIAKDQKLITGDSHDIVIAAPQYQQVMQMQVHVLEDQLFSIQLSETTEPVNEPYKEIFESSPMAMASVSLDGHLHEVNDLFCHMLGYDRKELTDKKFETFTYHEDISKSKVNFEALKKSGKPIKGIEKRYIRKNGDLIWVNIAANLIKDAQDNPVRVVITVIDITEQKNKEASLLESEEKYKALFNRAPLGYQSLDDKGHLVEVNEQWLQLLGYKKEEVVGKWFGAFIAPSSFETFKINFPLFKQQGSIHSVFEMLHKNGSTVHISLDGKIGNDKHGGFKQTHCILKDITKQCQLELALAEHQHLMNSLMDNTPDIIYIKNTEGKYLLFNQAAEELSGKKATNILGHGVEAVFPPQVAEKVMARDRDVLDKQEVITSEEEVLDAKGNIKTYLSTKGPIFDKDQALLGMFGISRDISERIESEQILRDREKKYRLITENVADVISVYNLNKREFVFISPSITHLRGYSIEEAMSQGVEDTVVPEALESFIRSMEDNVQEFIKNPEADNHYNDEVQMSQKNGGRIWVEISSRFQYNDVGEIETVNIIRSIEERKKTEEVMRQLSYFDQLTGLYNRRYYEEELHRLDTDRNLPISLIMADLNGLKLTNDAFGHQEGDVRLKKTADVLRKGCRADEIISRIGGDEFVILMPKTKAEQAQKVIERINKAVANERVDHGMLSLSIGYAVKENSSDQMHEIFKKAEDDMYRHKLAESSSMRSKTIDLIMNSLYEKSQREMHHSKRVSMICKTMASVMGFNQEDINQAEIAGLVHDIGKIGINNNILDKTGKLNKEEWEEVKKHCEVGYRILSSVNEFSEIAEYVLSHQERWDGKGYPQGLSGTTIPIQSRIIAVADAYDAMTSDRSYRLGMTEAEAIQEIEKCSGSQFDPEIARIFVDQAIPIMIKCIK